MKLREEDDYSLGDKWCVVENDAANACILMLAGRGQRQNTLPSIYWHRGLRDFRMVGLQTHAMAWYPMPKGAGDQRKAIRYIPHSIRTIEEAVTRIELSWHIPKEKIVLLGFSAGGVMALQVAAYSDRPYGGVVCQSGAILHTDSLPTCKHPTPILLTHSQDDDTFDWDERYSPMRSALLENHYPLTVIESPRGGHNLNDIDISLTKLFIRQCLRDDHKLR